MRWGSSAVCWGVFLLASNLFALPTANQQQIALSGEQAAWIAGHSPVRVGVTTPWPPFSYMSTNGTQAGIDIDVLRLISERTGLKIEIVADASWERLLKLFQEGRIDATTGTAETPEREELFRFTRPYYKSIVVIVTREGDWRFPHVSLLQKAIVAMPARHVTTTALKKRVPSARIIERDTEGECFELVAEKKADATVANLFAASQYLNEHPEKRLGISSVVSEFDFPLRLGVRRDYPILAGILDQALASISQEELDNIANRHLLFRLEGARRATLLHRRILAGVIGAAFVMGVFLAWNYLLRKEIRVRRTLETELRETNRSLEIFSHSISHDLRAPLRGICGMSQMLLEDYHEKLDGVGRDYLDRIIAATTRMDTLIRDVLAYSQVSRSEFPLVTVSLSQMVPQLIGEFPPAQGACFHIASELPDVRGNSTLLPQCICNLLSNAVKYVPEGRTPDVEIRSESKGSQARIWIKDNGIGIAPEDQLRIFKLFQRVESGQYQGTGIGLAVVAKGMERMGGSVGVESELGKGSQFWIQLPIAKSG